MPNNVGEGAAAGIHLALGRSPFPLRAFAAAAVNLGQEEWKKTKKVFATL
jgi:hypothetical protein